MTESHLRAQRFVCNVCMVPFANASNRLRHMRAQHPGVDAASTVSRVEEETVVRLQTRHLVDAIVSDMMRMDLNCPAEDVIEFVLAVVPEFSYREAEVIVAAVATTARHVALMHQSVDALRRSGNSASELERATTLRLVNAALGPSWGPAPSLGVLGRPRAADPMLACVGADTVQDWVRAANQATPAGPPAAAIGVVPETLVITELSEHPAVCDIDSSASVAADPQPLNPTTASRASQSAQSSKHASTSSSKPTTKSSSKGEHHPRPLQSSDRDRDRSSHGNDDRRRN